MKRDLEGPTGVRWQYQVGTPGWTQPLWPKSLVGLAAGHGRAALPFLALSGPLPWSLTCATALYPALLWSWAEKGQDPSALIWGAKSMAWQ